MIPKLIHFIMLGPARPDWAMKNIDGFEKLNPDWDVIIHKAPYEMADEYQRAFDEAHTIGEQADVLRMVVLETWGGWYFDWDTIAFKSLEGMKSVEGLGNRLLLAPTKSLPIALSYAMAAEPGGPVWDTVRKCYGIIADEGTPNGTTYERAICDMLTDRCPDKVRIGRFDEFGEAGPWKHANWGYTGLQAGTWTEGTGESYFLHGWVGESHQPTVRY